ncbi:XkdX family protein [Loigolactobacillus bifermentans]|jgi:uncharacterized XkdX family phage protein|nr:XkdX family protein [Loigolactobacillus bifermentans]QGG60073.1 XkdX family protein [Loigolactobacillus bifermentans]
MADMVKNYYKLGLYTNDNLKVFVQAGYITTADFQDLTGGVYSA